MKTIADLHAHARGDFNKVVDIISKRKGRTRADLAVLGYIDYGNQRTYEDFSKTKGYDRQYIGNSVYVSEKNILIISSQEIPTKLKNGKKGEIIVLGSKPLKQYRTLEETLQEAVNENGIILAPHPFLIESIGRELIYNPNLLEYLDALEIHNSQASLFNMNKPAKRYYDREIKGKYQIGAFSNSDAHFLYQLFSSYTKLDLNIDFFSINQEQLIQILRNEVRQHQDYSQDRQSMCLFGTLLHASKRVFIEGFLGAEP